MAVYGIKVDNAAESHYETPLLAARTTKVSASPLENVTSINWPWIWINNMLMIILAHIYIIIYLKVALQAALNYGNFPIFNM